MATPTKVRSFEISKLKSLLEKPCNPPEIKISSMMPSQFQTSFEIEVPQLRSATHLVT